MFLINISAKLQNIYAEGVCQTFPGDAFIITCSTESIKIFHDFMILATPITWLKIVKERLWTRHIVKDKIKAKHTTFTFLEPPSSQKCDFLLLDIVECLSFAV